MRPGRQSQASSRAGGFSQVRYTGADGDLFVSRSTFQPDSKESCMRNIIYIIGLIVVVLFILSMLGLR